MKLTTAYIISFLPDDPEIRARRKVLHKKQLDYWCQKDIRIVVYAQNYSDIDFDPRVHQYIVNTGVLKRPGPARNVLLEEFYETDSDFALFMDDDIVFYPGEKYMDNDNILNVLREIPVPKFQSVSCFQPLYPSQTPFSQMFRERKQEFRDNLIFQSHPNLMGACNFIKNFRKLENFDYFYEDLFNVEGKVEAGEDNLFGVNLIKRGLGAYQLQNLVCNDMGFKDSTWSSDDEHRKASKQLLKERLIAAGVPVKQSGGLSWSEFCSNYQCVRNVFIPKKEAKSLFC